MTNHTFSPGELVVHEATGERGTLTSTNGVSAVVAWDSTGGNSPADILPVTDLEPAHHAWCGPAGACVTDPTDNSTVHFSRPVSVCIEGHDISATITDDAQGCLVLVDIPDDAIPAAGIRALARFLDEIATRAGAAL